MRKKLLLVGLLCLSTQLYSQENSKYVVIENKNGAKLAYSPNSGVKILTVGGFRFKDLNKNGKLDKYEDWRLPVEERAQDLAKRMSPEQIAGLMLYSGHQVIPAPASGFSSSTYGGKHFAASGANAWDLNDTQKKFLKEDNLRHVLIMGVSSTQDAARWNNEMQAFVEGIGLGIPSNTSSDPRHAEPDVNLSKPEFNIDGGQISRWPDGLAMAATFDPQLVKQFGDVAAQEYRALGITTALSPQIDLATEPRWFRIAMTFGESPKLVTAMAKAYTDGFQTSEGESEIKDGWGYQSVNAMVKHWPSGGPEEGGRDGHWAFGKFAVYPGNNFETHLKPFTEGAFKLDGKTSVASAVMPYYTISYNQSKDGSNSANGFNKYIITDLLREKYGYDGVVCTDWGITHNEDKHPGIFAGKPWGVEDKSIDERHYIALMAGVDQYGGNNDKEPVLAAYQMGVKEHGKKFMRARFEQTAVRLLKNIFRLGLFENPYLDPIESDKIVGNAQFVKAGYDAQVKSIVLLKNKANVMPIKERKTVYIPKVYSSPIQDWFGGWSSGSFELPVRKSVIEQYYNITDDPNMADFALVFVESPRYAADGGGYSYDDRLEGGNGYIPISLQYGPYTATTAREHSIAAGDIVIDPEITNRSYKGKSTIVLNNSHLQSILSTKGMMGEKPVIVVTNLTRPMVFREFESKVDGIVARFGVSEKAVMDIVSGKSEPSGLLPVQMPANMETVEKQMEDVPFDMECHKDSEGNTYDFAFGLNWKGKINDERVAKYK